MTTATDTQVREYYLAVLAALDDLSAAQRADLTEDLELHLHEVAAEGGDLHARLGSPGAYAAELRTSAGLPSRLDVRARRARAWMVPLRRFSTEAQPGWWVARGILGGIAVGLAGGHGYWALRDVLVPRVLGARLLGVVLIVAGAFASVQLGRRSRTAWGRPLSWAANVAAAITIVALLALAPNQPHEADLAARFRAESAAIPEIAPLQRDACVYAPDGTPVTQAFLANADGQPIAVGGPAGADVQNVYPKTGVACPKLTAVHITATDAPTWVRASANGTNVYTGILQPGQTRVVLGRWVNIVAGNASSTRITVDGVDAGILGGAGQVYRGTWGTPPSDELAANIMRHKRLLDGV